MFIMPMCVALVVCEVLAVSCQLSGVVWCWYRGQEPRGSISDSCNPQCLFFMTGTTLGL